MDLKGPESLAQVLANEELQQIPEIVQEKINSFLHNLYDKYYSEKARGTLLLEYQERIENLELQLQDDKVKLEKFDQNVRELREQLESVSTERNNLLTSLSAMDRETSELRLEKNRITDERDSLLKMIESQKMHLDRLQDELRLSQDQLRKAINDKCDVIVRIEEIESKEKLLEFKETRFEQERNMLQGQIQTLTEDLSRNNHELQTMRRDNMLKHMQLDTQLTQKKEALKFSQTQCEELKELIEQLQQEAKDLNGKLLMKAEEANKLMDFYKKELAAKDNLLEMVKSNSYDNAAERNELTACITELRRLLTENTEQYGQLETELKATKLQHELELDEKQKQIDGMRHELKVANDLLKTVKEESTENAIARLAPTAAMASRLLRTDMSLTELYSLYVKSTEELSAVKRENAQVKLEIKQIINEVGERAPALEKRALEYDKLKETFNILSQHRDELVIEKANLEEQLQNFDAKIVQMEKEKGKMRQAQIDLGRQLVYMLQEVESWRTGKPTNHQDADPAAGADLSNANAIISQKLITFKDATELLANNEKLIFLVRDLSERLEKAENSQDECDVSAIKQKLEGYRKRVDNMQQTLNKQNHTVATLIDKCERYKKLYFQMKQKDGGGKMDIDHADVSDDSNDATEMHTKVDGTSVSAEQGTSKIRTLEQELQLAKDNYRVLKEQYDYYIHEKKQNEKLLNEQFDAMRSELREHTSSNCKLNSQLEFSKEQLKLQQKNVAVYKQQISTLEERNRNYEQAIMKHEQTVLYLRDEVIKLQKNLSVTDAENNRLQHENRIIKDSVNRLQTERELYFRQQQSDNLLLSNIEQIKCNLERSELEGRQRLEQNLNDTMRELGATRRRLEEEEQRFNELSKELRKETELAIQRAQEHQQLAENARTELQKAREELSSKSEKIDDLSKKLQESLTPSVRDNPIAKANKKARDLEHQLNQAKEEINLLNNDLKTIREHAMHYEKLAEVAEVENRKLHEINEEVKKTLQAELDAAQQREQQWKTRAEELETESRLMSMTDVNKQDQTEQSQAIQNELRESIQTINEKNRKLREQNNQLSESLHNIEIKFANEMRLHSQDMQELAQIKEENSKIGSQIQDLCNERDIARSEYNQLRSSHESTLQVLNNEKEELEKRIDDLNSHNSNLHDQIEALTTKLSILSQQSHSTNTSAANISINDSTNSVHETSMNDNNAEQQLLIIKFLRKEKNLISVKLDTAKAENARLSSELTILQKKSDELENLLKQERSKSASNIGSFSQHEDVIRKIGQLDAITDSNRILREERNMAQRKVSELIEKINALESELYPLKATCQELNGKVENCTSENKILKDEASKWRVRANQLVEKSQRNPEEFKRLQLERESLAKMCSAEQEHVKRLTEELEAIKTEKTRLENVIANYEKQVQVLQEEKKKLSDDFLALRVNHARLSQEVVDLKTKLLEKEDMLQKLKEDFDNKEAQLQDSKNKEVQIRKIAKRYKDSYLELSNKTAEAGVANSLQDSSDIAGGSTANTDSTAAVSSAEELEQLKAMVEARDKTMQELEEEKEKMRQKYEDLQATVEMDDHTKSLLREAKIRIVSLNDENTVKTEELKEKNLRLNELLQAVKNHETTIAALTAEAKTLQEQYNLSKEAVARITRENDSLQMRITQLNRQLGLQQSAKPSTSSVAITDKSSNTESSPRTANVKPMSGASTMQQSATVTPWRGSETPLASIRPLSVQNSRTAAILPTSQQPAVGGTSSSSTSTSSTPSSGSCSNTALVPPQQVHTTGNSSIEAITSSPTSSHTDYMPSTSSAAVVVAAVQPMGSANAAESSQEAESVQQPQPAESQLLLGSGAQQQVVALVSPRVEGSTQNISSPNLHMQQQQQQQEALNQLPSTSGSTSSSSHVVVSCHNRHTPSSSSVTTTQAATSGHKRPRDDRDDSFATDEDCTPDKSATKHAKRVCAPTHSGDLGSGVDVEYQVPTSSQRDQEDDIVVVDSEDEEEEEEDGMAEADDGPMTVDMENEAYEDSYEPDHNVDDGESAEVNIQTEAESDNNEVEMSESVDVSSKHGATSADYADGASTSQAAAAAAAASASASASQQQSQTISSGTAESALQPWKQPGVPFGRQQKSAHTEADASVLESTEGDSSTSSGSRRTDGSSEIVSSPQTALKFAAQSEEAAASAADKPETEENIAEESDLADTEQAEPNDNESSSLNADKKLDTDNSAECAEEAAASEEVAETSNLEGQHSGGATQSEIEDVQQSQVEASSEDNEGADGVSSEGEKPTHEDIEEEEGREAEATTPSTNTRLTRSTKTTGSGSTPRRPARAGTFQRGGRPTPIVWQDQSGNSRNQNNRTQDQQMQGSSNRGNFSPRGSNRGRRMRRPNPSGNFGNMRYP